MKIIIVLIFALVLSSCYPKSFIEKRASGHSEVYLLDFRPFLEKGFIFSTGAINQKYTPIGIISLVFSPDTLQYWTINNGNYNTVNMRKVQEDGKEYIIWKTETEKSCDINTVLDKAYNEAVKIGANGIIEVDFILRGSGEIELSGTAVNVKN